MPSAQSERQQQVPPPVLAVLSDSVCACVAHLCFPWFVARSGLLKLATMAVMTSK